VWFVRPVTRRTAVLGTVTGALIVAGLAVGGGQARAATPTAQAAPLVGSASAALAQVNAGEWATTVYLDTAALRTGTNPAGITFTLVTGKPNTVIAAAAPAYPDGPLACGAAAVNPVTQVKLTFTPSLSAVPQTATLTVTPPQALLTEGDPPVQVPLTVRRTVSPWQYVIIPAICGGALAVLLLLVLMAIGMPRKDASLAPPPGTAPPGQEGQAPQHGQVDFNVRLLLFLMARRHEVLVTEMPVLAGVVQGGAAAIPVGSP
jgi:hypothetical protein